MADKKHILGVFEYFLIAGVVICNLVYAYCAGEWDAIGIIAAVAGVLCVALAANGSIWNYVFGVIQVSFYAYISFKATAYGNAAVNAFYYFPMQFIGWWQWRKRGAQASSGADSVVSARRMTPLQRLWLALGIAAFTLGLAFILRHFNDAQPWTDAFTTMLCIAAQALMTFAFMEQWVLWLVFNVFTVVMWSVFVARGTPHAVPTLIMYVFYMLNSVNGLIVWNRLSRR